MRLSLQLARWCCGLVFTACALVVTAQTVDTARRAKPSPPAPAAEGPAYPLVIRIGHTAFDSLEAREIDHHSRVDRVVLGTHAVGTSRTRGAISVLLIPDRNDASFDVHFQGQTYVNTVGANGPALIRSHTCTDFVCTRQISFHPRKGFIAVASTVVANTQLVYDGFGSSRGLLGRRLISAVAKRRAGESHEEARQIAARDTEHELLQAFDKRLNAQLITMNRSMNLARYVNLFIDEASAIRLSARSSNDCIYVGVGREGRPARLTTLPPRSAAVAPIEIAVHSTFLGGRAAKLLCLFDNKMVLPPTARQEILRSLLVPDEESAGIMDIGVYDGWFILGLQNGTLASSPTATTRRESSNR